MNPKERVEVQLQSLFAALTFVFVVDPLPKSFTKILEKQLTQI